MDLQTLAATALSTLTPFLLQGAGGIAGGALESIGQQLWELVQQPFTKDDSDKVLIDQYRQDPTHQRTQGAVEYRLQCLLKHQPELAAQLKALLARPEMQEAARQVYVNRSENVVIDSIIFEGRNANVNSGNNNVKRR